MSQWSAELSCLHLAWAQLASYPSLGGTKTSTCHQDLVAVQQPHQDFSLAFTKSFAISCNYLMYFITRRKLLYTNCRKEKFGALLCTVLLDCASDHLFCGVLKN